MDAIEKNDFPDEEDDDFDNGESGESGQALGHPRAIAQSTVETYHRFVKTLRRNYLRSLGGELPKEEASPVQLAEFLIENASRYRPKTFSAYRAGLVYWLGTQSATTEVLQATLLLSTSVPKAGYKGVAPDKTASLYSHKSSRPRTFRRRRFERLLTELTRRSTYSGRATPDEQNRSSTVLVWLKAGLASGLRPVEWDTARWEDPGHTILRVKTAKHKVGLNVLPEIAAHYKPLPEIRYVTIDPEDRMWVEQHLANIQRYKDTGGSFSRFYHNNRRVLWNTCVDLFGPNEPKFTLYLMRGQFAANRKQTKSGKDVAEEMGCGLNVVFCHYGKKSGGHHHAGDAASPSSNPTDTTRPTRTTPPIPVRKPQPAGEGA